MSYGWAEILAHAGAFLATTLVLHTLYWVFCRVKGKAYDGKGNPLFMIFCVILSTVSASMMAG